MARWASDACKRSPTEQLLYAFSRAFLHDPRRGMPMDAEAQKVYALLTDQVEQFRKTRGPGAMKYEELAKKSLKELMEPVLREMSPEEIARFFTPEQRLAALKPEEIARVLKPEEIARVLTPEQRLAGLTSEEIDRVLAARKREKRRAH